MCAFKRAISSHAVITVICVLSGWNPGFWLVKKGQQWYMWFIHSCKNICLSNERDSESQTCWTISIKLCKKYRVCPKPKHSDPGDTDPRPTYNYWVPEGNVQHLGVERGTKRNPLMTTCRGILKMPTRLKINRTAKNSKQWNNHRHQQLLWNTANSNQLLKT